MIFTFFITIVFIAEIIITVALFNWLFKLDKRIIELNQTVIELKPGISDVVKLVRKISEQIKDLTKSYTDKFISDGEINIIKFLINSLAGLLFWKLNIKFLRKLRKTKGIKLLSKAFNLLQIVV